MGRVGVDLYPEQIGVPLAEVRTFRKLLGGSATNVAVAAARLGRRSGVITKVGDDPFGPYVRQAMDGFGVDPSRVGTHPSLRTPVVFCEIFPPDHFPLLFYREPTAPDMTLEPGELDLDEIASVPLFWTTGTGLSAEPSRAATLAALEARGRRAITVHDLDYRPMFWGAEADAGRYGREAVQRATVAVGGRTEAVPLVGELSAVGHGEGAARARRRARGRQARPRGRPRGEPGGRGGDRGADPGRGRQRARRGRRLRRGALPRAPLRLGARADDPLRERGRGARRLAARLRRRHADRRGGRGALQGLTGLAPPPQPGQALSPSDPDPRD